MPDLKKIRNFCIIAHIDHGKSTLADRLLEITGTVPDRDMRQQLLDQMDIERERGITVKLAPVRMKWREHELNLIDTPGHVDFSYEVSRSLAAVEGAILVVDATQGIQAQTLANLAMAKEQGLVIIPVINKIDLPNADVKKTAREISNVLKIDDAQIISVSGKTGQYVTQVLDAVIAQVPPPRGHADGDLRALIFDSLFDPYQGVIAYVRLMDGRIAANERIKFIGTAAQSVCLGVGIFKPQREKTAAIMAGEIGYIVTGLKEIRQVNVGDTIVRPETKSDPLPGYRQVQPMVYAGFFPPFGQEAKNLRQALEKLRLNDAALSFEPENSPAIGSGFRCGFLGLLHLDIIRERLHREYGLAVIMTTPSVAYRVYRHGRADFQVIRSPLALPDPASIAHLEEPILQLDVLSPSRYIGAIMEVADRYRGHFKGLDYLDSDRAMIHFQIPLASILVDFYDTIKSASNGYATVDYHLSGYQPADVIRLDVLIAGRAVEALSSMVYRDTSYQTGRRITERLKSILPRQMFEVKIQAAIGGQIIASETVPAMRKDVTAKLYGGDVTRKRKLLEKQKRGKKRMKDRGQIEIPQAAYFEVLKNSR